MNIAGLAAAGNVPFVKSGCLEQKRAIMRILLQLVVVGLIWEKDACWLLKEAAWQRG